MLSEYLDGELPAGRHRQVEEHLSQCPQCAAELQTLRRTIEAVRELPVHPAPDDLSERVQLALEQETIHPPVRRVFALWPRVAAVAAMFAVVVGITFLLRESGFLSPEAPPRDRLAMQAERERPEQAAVDRTETKRERAREGRRLAGEEVAGTPKTAVQAEMQEGGEMGRGRGEAASTMRKKTADAYEEAPSADRAERMAESGPAPPAAESLQREAQAAGEPADTSSAQPHQILTVRTGRRLEAAWRAVRLAGRRGLRRAEIVVGENGEINLALQMHGNRYEDFLVDLAGSFRNEKALRNAEATAADPYFRRLTRLYAFRDKQLEPAGGQKLREAPEIRRAQRPSVEAGGRAARALRSAPAPAGEPEKEQQVQERAEEEKDAGYAGMMKGLQPPDEVVLRIRFLLPGRRPDADLSGPSE